MTLDQIVDAVIAKIQPLLEEAFKGVGQEMGQIAKRVEALENGDTTKKNLRTLGFVTKADLEAILAANNRLWQEKFEAFQAGQIPIEEQTVVRKEEVKLEGEGKSVKKEEVVADGEGRTVKKVETIIQPAGRSLADVARDAFNRGKGSRK